MLRITNEYKFCMVLEDMLVERLRQNIMKNSVIWKSVRLKPVK